MKNFVVYTLPRSRSYWLSRFLEHGDWTCGHDEIRRMRSLEDVRAWLSIDSYGTVETGAAPWWRIQRDMCPTARVATIRRDPAEVIESVMRWPLPMDRDIIARNVRQVDRKLDLIERNVPNVMRVEYDDLRNEETCKALFEFCLQEPHDHGWWAALDPLNLQINLRSLIRYEMAFGVQRSYLLSAANREVMRLSFKHRTVQSFEDFVFSEEPFDKFWEEGQHLFREHCVLVGEPPDQYQQKNVPLMRKLGELGCLQIITARSNGKMFGYLATILSPDMEHVDPRRHVAQQTSWYASPDAKGIGLKLQRESIRRLEERNDGIWRVVQRAGIRGEGPRLDVMYRRLGAKPDGEMWTMEVGRA